MKSVKDADSVVICDTGSTDKTVSILRKYGAEVHEIQVNPWRFDLARNMSLLHLQDADIAVSMDIDEVTLPGWRKRIEEAWIPGTTILRYPFVHNWEDKNQTIPRLSVWGFKVHCPKSYIWKYPIHETLESRDNASDEKIITINEELMRHYPDPNKNERWGRIELLKMAAEEDLADQRMSHLYGRELWFHGRHKEAIVELKRHLTLTIPYIEPTYDTDGLCQTRSTSCRLIARCLMADGGSPDEIMVWLLRGVAESPSQREPWVALADAWLTVGDAASAYAAALRGLAITDRLRSSELEEWCWGEHPQELAERAYKILIGGSVHVSRNDSWRKHIRVYPGGW